MHFSRPLALALNGLYCKYTSQKFRSEYRCYNAVCAERSTQP
jgi:hypothetical protein